MSMYLRMSNAEAGRPTFDKEIGKDRHVATSAVTIRPSHLSFVLVHVRWQGHWHIYEQQHLQKLGPSKWTIAPDGYQIKKAKRCAWPTSIESLVS